MEDPTAYRRHQSCWQEDDGSVIFRFRQTNLVTIDPAGGRHWVRAGQAALSQRLQRLCLAVLAPKCATASGRACSCASPRRPACHAPAGPHSLQQQSFTCFNHPCRQHHTECTRVLQRRHAGQPERCAQPDWHTRHLPRVRTLACSAASAATAKPAAQVVARCCCQEANC